MPLFIRAQNDSTNRQMTFKWPSGFKLNGQRLKSYEAKNEFLKAPGAITYFKRYKTQSYVSYGSFLLAAVFARIAIDNETNNKNSTGWYIAGGGLFITFFVINFRAQKNRGEAIRLYNDSYSTKN
ncbi:MAG TPA: hypothetical protein VK492_03585 [Chitinophagaceae bacterium]|nr:hypothetical protein [Chitinophagaceae bacterium]